MWVLIIFLSLPIAHSEVKGSYAQEDQCLAAGERYKSGLYTCEYER